jgi:hypothetical protein
MHINRLFDRQPPQFQFRSLLTHVKRKTGLRASGILRSETEEGLHYICIHGQAGGRWSYQSLPNGMKWRGGKTKGKFSLRSAQLLSLPL